MPAYYPLSSPTYQLPAPQIQHLC